MSTDSQIADLLKPMYVTGRRSLRSVPGYWGFCLELVLAGVNPRRDLCFWQWSPD
jgi:hypothetical protein